MAGNGDAVTRPKSWDKAVSAAYLRALGVSIADAASAAGVGERTLERWGTCSWWADAMAEARDRWMNDLTAASRDTVLNAVRQGNASLAMSVLERTEPGLMPPAQRIHHDGEIEHRHFVAEIPPVESVDEWRKRYSRNGTPSAS